jgi:hypothetical protein
MLKRPCTFMGRVAKVDVGKMRSAEEVFRLPTNSNDIFGI